MDWGFIGYCVVAQETRSKIPYSQSSPIVQFNTTPTLPCTQASLSLSPSRWKLAREGRREEENGLDVLRLSFIAFPWSLRFVTSHSHFAHRGGRHCWSVSGERTSKWPILYKYDHSVKVNRKCSYLFPLTSCLLRASLGRSFPYICT